MTVRRGHFILKFVIYSLFLETWARLTLKNIWYTKYCFMRVAFFINILRIVG